MTKTVSAYSTAHVSYRAAEDLIQQIVEEIPHPNAVMVFLSAQHSHIMILQELVNRFPEASIVGCSSAGEFDSKGRGEGSASAFAIESSEMVFQSSMATGLSAAPEAAGRHLLSTFRGAGDERFRYRAAMILNDALAGSADELVRTLYMETGGKYKFFGGGAGDDGAFSRTYVFCGTEVATDAVVALEILSMKPIGVGVRHGWSPATEPMRVTESKSNRVGSLDAVSTAEVFEQHAEMTGQYLDRDAPLPFFLHNIAGMKLERGYKLRVPLGIVTDGSVSFAAEIPEGSAVSIMTTTVTSSVEAASDAASDAMRQLGDFRAAGALMFDCVATRLRLGKHFSSEIDAVHRVVGNVALAGCNTYGQVATSEDQSAGFHNCNAVVCVFPE